MLLISDELLISKEKVELSATICKTDLISEIVGEFPELQGIMGGHLSNVQGFDKEIVDAIKSNIYRLVQTQLFQKNHLVLLYHLLIKLTL